MQRILITAALALSLSCSAVAAFDAREAVEPDNPVVMTVDTASEADQLATSYLLRTSTDLRCELQPVEDVARAPRLVTDAPRTLYASQPVQAVPALDRWRT